MRVDSRFCLPVHDLPPLPLSWAAVRGVTIRYPHDTIRIAIYLSHDTIRIAIPGENRKMNQLITIGSLYCILCVCSFDLSRQHLAFALLLFNSMNTLYIIVRNKLVNIKCCTCYRFFYIDFPHYLLLRLHRPLYRDTCGDV